MKYLRMIVLVVFLLLIIILAVQNHDAFSTRIQLGIDLVFYSYQTAAMTIYLVTIISFLVGIVFAALYGIVERFRLKKQIKILQKEAREKDKELNSLRNLPVTTEVQEAEQPSEVQ